MHKLISLILISISLSACSTQDVLRAPLDVTIGQQLIDLKVAFDKGAMTKAEYDTQRSLLINSVK